MRQLSITPSITVTIGRHTRLYFAFVTTAPAELDSPATVTLARGDRSRTSSASPRIPITHDELARRTPARLVLVDAMELAWQRAKYRGHQHLLLRCGSVARRPQHAAALALAAPASGAAASAAAA